MRSWMEHHHITLAACGWHAARCTELFFGRNKADQELFSKTMSAIPRRVALETKVDEP